MRDVKLFKKALKNVTILILIDGFLQYDYVGYLSTFGGGHNPYFNRWFSAINIGGMKVVFKYCHNPYFNRWFSAMGTVSPYMIQIP